MKILKSLGLIAFGSAILLCMEFPAHAQTVDTVPRTHTVWPTSTYRVSELLYGTGHALDGCVWKTGVNCSYNAAPLINAKLALATLVNPVDMVFDISVGIGGCLLIPQASSVIIEGLSNGSTGVFMAAGSNSTAVSVNFPGIASTTTCLTLFDGLSPIPAQSGSAITRNFNVEHNKGTYPNGNCNNGDVRCGGSSGPWATVFQMGNLEYVEFDNVYSYDPVTYSFYASNVGRFVANNISCNSPSVSSNTDCVHLSGPFSSCLIDRVWGNVGDDMFGINDPEGYGGNGGPCAITNVVVNTAPSVMRIYANTASTNFTQAPITITNITGNTTAAFQYAAFIFGNSAAHNLDEVQGLQIVNANLTVRGNWFAIGNNIGRLSCTSCTWYGPTDATPMLTFQSASTVSDMALTDFKIYRNTAGHAAAYGGLIPSGSTIKRLEQNGVAVVNESGRSDAAIGYFMDVQSGGLLSNWVINGTDCSLMTALTNTSFARITNVSGGGLLGCGLQVPDANVVNGVSYMSATSALPSVKIGGTVGGIDGVAVSLTPRVKSVVAASQVAAITTTTLYTVGATNGSFLLTAALNCDTTSAAATANMTFGWTDPSNTAQTATLGSAVACTALGSSAMGNLTQTFAAKAGTNITYATSIVNTPTYDLRVSLDQKTQ